MYLSKTIRDFQKTLLGGGWRLFDFHRRNMGTIPPPSKDWQNLGAPCKDWHNPDTPYIYFLQHPYMCSMALFELFQCFLIISFCQNQGAPPFGNWQNLGDPLR